MLVFTKATVDTIWVPHIYCDSDIEVNCSIQDLGDCAMVDREAVKDYFLSLVERFKEEWSDFSDVSSYSTDEEEAIPTWYGMEFDWDFKGKKYRCAIIVDELPLVKVSK